jgi:hypothetical protein
MNEVLLNIYKESNEHLRASDNKRDQTIAFYLIIIGLLFGSLDKFKDLTVFVALTIGCLGIVIALILTTLRKWHIVYVNTAIVVQYLALNNLQPSEDAIKDVWEKLIWDGSYKVRKNPRTGKKYSYLSTENLTFIAFLVIAFMPFYLLNSNLWMVLVHFAYVVVINTISNGYIKRELSDGYRGSWLLRINLPANEQ